MRIEPIITGETYHVFNKSIGGIDIFTNSINNKYFLETLSLVNSTEKPDLNWLRETRRSKKKFIQRGEKLIDFCALNLMPNHFHFLIRQLVDGGIARFMQRALNSYARFVNLKLNRKGPLFISRYKAKRIESDIQGEHIFTYIHGNALDLFNKKWRTGKLEHWEKAERFLQNYPWSSLNVFTKQGKVDPLIIELINTDFAKNYFDNTEDHLKSIREWAIGSLPE